MKKKKKYKQMDLRFYSTALFAVLAVVGFSQQTLSLKDCINYGLQHNLTIKRAEMDLKNNQARVLEGVSAYLPQIQAKGTFTDNIKLQTMMLPGEFMGQPAGTFLPVKFGTQYNMNGGVYGYQTLYDQSYISSISAARESNKIFETQIVKSEEQVILDIATLFYATQVNAEQIKLLEYNLANVSQLAEVTKVSLENGFAKKIDYDRLAVTKANLETSLQNARLGNQQQLRALKYQMGMSLDENIQLQIVNKEIVEPTVSVDIFSAENNVDFKLVQINRKVSKILRKATLAGYAPTLSFNFNYNYLYQANDMKFYAKGAPWTSFSAFGLSLNVPIFDGLQKHWKAQQQKIQLQQLDLDERNLKEGLKFQNSNAQDKLTTNILSVKEKKNSMSLAEEVYKVSQTSYQQGMAGLSDLLNADKELQEAQFNYLNALFQIKIAELELLKTSGNIRSILN